MAMETNKTSIQVQDTEHVMNCKLGVWYSDDKITGFKVLERNEQSTSMKIEIGSNKYT